MAGIGARMLMAATKKDLQLSFLSAYISSANAASYTYNTVSIGTPANDRYVIIAAYVVVGTGGINLTTVTLDGVTMTPIVTKTNSTSISLGFYGLLVPGGTTATVVVSASGTSSRSAIASYSMTGYNSTSSTGGTYGSVDNVGTFNFTMPKVTGGCGLVCAWGQTNSANTSWSGLTENYDTQPEASDTWCGASEKFTVTNPFAIVTGSGFVSASSSQAWLWVTFA